MRDSARPRARRGVGDGRVLRLPVVERLAGADLHGRHRLARARRADGRARDPDPHRAAARRARRPVRDDHHVVDHADRLVQVHPNTHRHRETDLPDGAAAPPLRARRAGSRSPSSSGSGSSPGWPSPSGWACSTPTSSAMADVSPRRGARVLVCGVGVGRRLGGRGRLLARGARVAAHRDRGTARPVAALVAAGARWLGRARPSCRPMSTWSSPRPGCGRTDPLLLDAADARRPGVGRGRAGLAAARRRRRRRGSRSPARTARPRPSACSSRCCARPACARSRSATSACR